MANVSTTELDLLKAVTVSGGSTDALNVVVSGGGTGSGNAAASATGAAVPTSADYVGFNSSGNLVGVSSTNPLPVAVTGTQAVTGSVSVTNFPSSQAVTGTFFQSTQPVSGTVAISALPSDVTPATLTITAVDTASTSAVYFNNQTWYSGTPTTGSVAAFALSSYETGQLEITGTWTGTLQNEVSFDGGTNWIAHSIHQIGAAAFVSSFTNNIVGSLNLAGKTNVRVRATAGFSGTATIRYNFSRNDSSVYVANAVKLLDGSSTTSSTQMNIVPASTAAATTNTAIVTAFSPNTPLPTGTNPIGSVSVSNFPSSQAVTGTFFQTTQPVSGSISVIKGNQSPAAPGSATVGTTSGTILSANLSRTGAVVINLSSANVSFGLNGNTAVAGSGITITPNGVWEMDQYTFTTGAITAIATAASSPVAIQEFS
ncbi:unnamed protein product [Sphagnum balticum]